MTTNDSKAIVVPIPDAVREIYGPYNLSASPAFAGGFINFGHWGGIPLDRPLTVADRIRSQRDLYLHVLGTLGHGAGRSALEVGCGLGLGCALALTERGFTDVTGLDIHPEQLGRARDANHELLAAESDRLRFAQGAAEAVPFPDASFDCVYTVEAAQHFRDLAAFAHEATRVLRPGGRVAVTSFFVPDEAPAEAASRLTDMLNSFAYELDVPHRLGVLTGALADGGLTDVRTESIGADVWRAHDEYLAGPGNGEPWARNFLRAHQEGLLDYYVITADRPRSAAA